MHHRLLSSTVSEEKSTVTQTLSPSNHELSFLSCFLDFFFIISVQKEYSYDAESIKIHLIYSLLILCVFKNVFKKTVIVFDYFSALLSFSCQAHLTSMFDLFHYSSTSPQGSAFL